MWVSTRVAFITILTVTQERIGLPMILWEQISPTKRKMFLIHMATFLFEPSSKDIITNSCTQILQKVIKTWLHYPENHYITWQTNDENQSTYHLDGVILIELFTPSNTFSLKTSWTGKKNFGSYFRSWRFTLDSLLWDEHERDLLLCGTLYREHPLIGNAIKKMCNAKTTCIFLKDCTVNTLNVKIDVNLHRISITQSLL